VGLGTMGLAELLIRLEIRYGSPESLEFLDKLYGFIAREAYLASTEIAAEKARSRCSTPRSSCKAASCAT